MTEKLNILACRNFSREISKVLEADEFKDVILTLLSARCGHPPVSEDEIDSIKKNSEPESDVHILGCCCLTGLPTNNDPVYQLDVSKLDQCFYMFSSKDIIDKYLIEGCYLITPGWLSQWRKQISYWGFDKDSAQEFFAESSKKLLLIDTGIDPESTKNIKEFSDYVNLPYEISSVGLDYLRLIISKIVIEWRYNKEKSKNEDLLNSNNKHISDYAMTLDLLNSLTKFLNEDDIIANVLELYKMLFAPKTIYYVPRKDDQPGNIISSPEAESSSEELISIIAHINSGDLWTDTENGVLIQIRYLEETIGFLLLDKLLFPDLREKYRDLGLSIAVVCGLAITNARKYQQIIASQLHLESVLESSKDTCIFSLDREFRYTAFNNRHKMHMRQINDAEIEIGTNFLDSFSVREMSERTKLSLERVLHGESFIEIQMHTDLTMYNELSWNPIVAENGEIEGITCFANDITERKQIEGRLRLHSEVMTNMVEGVYLIGLNDGKIVYTNPRFEEMFGYDPGEMVGKDVSIVNAPTDKDPVKTTEEIMEVLLRTGEWHGEVENIKKDGTHFWCYANVSIFDHQQYGRVLVSVHTDITDRKIVEKEKEKLISELQQALKEVKTLKDFIPICASCKKIRDDKGFWSQIESYISEQTGSQFSHGICPDCRDDIYGEILNKK
ncbi:PAS domain S-box protein [candidate division KSB1 bacterium]